MEKKQSEFNKVFSAWDILVIAFGAMIGWGWVVSSGGWIQKGGVLGAALGFVVGGVMIFFVGLTYAELTAAMPQCGGEHVWSHRAMGPTGSFVCTWAIVLGYVGVACFEACAFPTIISYLWPGFLKGYLYTVAGFDIYASWLIVAIIVAFCIMLINIVGAKTAAKLQTILTIIIGGAGILLIVASVINGTVDNLDGQMFAEVGGGGIVKSILSVAVISPFYLIGFDVIPQAAEEINVPPKKIGGMLMLVGSLFAGIAFSFARLGNVHAMSHPISAYFDVPHGVANAVLLPVIAEYNALADHGRYFKIFNYISPFKVDAGEFEPGLLPGAIRELCGEIGIPNGIVEAVNNASRNGPVSREAIEEKIEAMAADAMKSGNIAVNPRASRQSDIEMLYRRAL